MKKINSSTIDQYLSFLGYKRDIPAVQESAVIPTSLQDELKINLIYHKARSDYLIKLNQLNDELFVLDDQIDNINKLQLSKRTRKQSVKEIIIAKDTLAPLMHRINELINVIATNDISLPLCEMDYTILCNFEHFVQHAMSTYEKLKIELKARAAKLNVSL